MKTGILYKELTERVIKCFYNVYSELGSGFLESVYEKSLMVEFESIGIGAEYQKSLNIHYKNRLVGEFRADIVVEGKIIIEIKAVSKLLPVHEAQLLNYLKATGLRIGFLVNFGDRLEFKRKIF
jgi:GxxExxY protein